MNASEIISKLQMFQDVIPYPEAVAIRDAAQSLMDAKREERIAELRRLAEEGDAKKELTALNALIGRPPASVKKPRKKRMPASPAPLAEGAGL